MNDNSRAHDKATGSWLALITLCIGVLMTVLDSTIVNVALPSIQANLRLSPTALVWVVNAYMLTFGGSLIVVGRLGDVHGHRRMYLIGVALFTVASLACGGAGTALFLIAARAVQGVGGAIVVATALSLIVNMFPEPARRGRALGVYAFVSAAGSSVGLLLGGALTSLSSWRWIFFINIPVGFTVWALSASLLRNGAPTSIPTRIGVWGAATLTASLALLVYWAVNAAEQSWISVESFSLLACALFLFVLFILSEARASQPLMPTAIFQLRTFAWSNLLYVLWAAGMCAWFFLSVLYLRVSLGADPMRLSLAFLPMNLIAAIAALAFSARLVARFGIGPVLSTGLLLGALGLVLLVYGPASVDLISVVPSMSLIGLGTGIALNPLLQYAMREVTVRESGLASGILSTARLLGGALGLAVFSGIAGGHTRKLIRLGIERNQALVEGYEFGLLLAAVCVGLAAVTAFVCTRASAPQRSAVAAAAQKCGAANSALVGAPRAPQADP